MRPAPSPEVDFEYVIHNADGSQVEQCGNGSRCFVRYVREQGLTDKTTVRVQVANGVLALSEQADGRVRVDMGPPLWDAPRVPFDVRQARALDAQTWALDLPGGSSVAVGVVSMGNPHAVQRVEDVETAPVTTQGPLIEHHAAFPNRVNAGFLQIVSRREVRLRVFERGAGETLACGTGACAAVVCGIRWGLLDAEVDVHTRGGLLSIAWAGEGQPVFMTGPATTVFEGEIDLPALNEN